MSFLGIDFFQRDVCEVAQGLLGVELVWGGCSGIIVETEAYAAEGDPACHVATRAAAREFIRTHAPGAAYVYLNYGMYWLLNFLVKGGARDGMVLIRALEPASGIARMRERRRGRPREEWCSGPGKLGRALGLTGADHGRILSGTGRTPGYGFRPSKERTALPVRVDVRVGITKAVDFPWRYLVDEPVRGNACAGATRQLQGVCSPGDQPARLGT
jgi:DNA-3-methyladenine glycosylase